MSDGHHRSSTALTVVLFILLIIVGTSFMSGY
ncbi:YjcZ family sporulation protein [Bacillus sp. sid0103]|nr:YjcZ family sporulation protein [Bacillus sp. sid0103]MBV7508933.1 YjcZ family sporulation protein [Bacillus sp. sid0103]